MSVKKLYPQHTFSIFILPPSIKALQERLMKRAQDSSETVKDRMTKSIGEIMHWKEYDYVIWLDADTYTFRQMPKEFLQQLLPQDTMLTYLGRENPTLNDGGKDPECGFVGYNLNHPEIQNYNKY